VFLHPSCVLLHANPEFIVFQEIVETSKLYMRGRCQLVSRNGLEMQWNPLTLFHPQHFQRSFSTSIAIKHAFILVSLASTA